MTILLLLVLSGKALDAKTNEVASLLRCPVCQGMSVADSPSEMAVNMKHQVREMLAQGYTEQQILDHFEKSYGEFVLLKPKNKFIWWVPLLAIAIGVFVVWRVFRLKGRFTLSVPGEQPAPSERSESRGMRGSRFTPAFAMLGAVLAIGAWYVVQPKASVEVEPQAVASSLDPIQQLESTIAKNPDNLTARVELAKLYFDKNDLMRVFEQTQYVLERTPDDARAMTYQAFVRIAMGQPANAETLLRRATTINPDITDAWVAIAWINTQNGHPADARAAIEQAVMRHPEDRDRLMRVYADMTR